MQSFRTELENLPYKTGQTVIEKDIIDLEKKISLFKEGKIDPEKFRSLRLARGVYGQRQQGVQMVRIKLPFGRITVKQLLRIADISDEYSNGRCTLPHARMCRYIMYRWIKHLSCGQNLNRMI